MCTRGAFIKVLFFSGQIGNILDKGGADLLLHLKKIFFPEKSQKSLTFEKFNDLLLQCYLSAI